MLTILNHTRTTLQGDDEFASSQNAIASQKEEVCGDMDYGDRVGWERTYDYYVKRGRAATTSQIDRWGTTIYVVVARPHAGLHFYQVRTVAGADIRTVNQKAMLADPPPELVDGRVG